MKSAVTLATGMVLALFAQVRTKTPAAHPPAKASPPPAKGSPAPIKTPPPTQVFSWMRPAAALPVLPRIEGVRIEAAKDRVMVIEEVTFPRGEWHTGGLELYVAFGAPGTPIAVDARLAGVPEGNPEPWSGDAGESLTVEPALRRGPRAQPLLGKPQMAGVVVRVTDGQLRRAYAAGEVAALRIRSLLAPPAADASGAHGVVVRLGAPAGLPLTLGRVEVASLEPHPWIVRAQAALCGPDADGWPLSVTVLPKGAPSPGATIAPEMAVRHAGDDLCVRWWTGP